MASSVTFSGLATNLPTDQLIQAVMDQASQPIQRMQAKQTLNNQRLSLLRTLNANILALNTSVGRLSTAALTSRTVTSSDANGTYVAATATGATTGNYDVHVDRIATRAQMNNASMALADATSAKVFDDSTLSSATFKLAGTDGKTYTITLDSAHNTLNGLRDAINASGAPVQASVVNTGSGATPYRLILSASSTGAGSNGGAISVMQASGGANTLGISSNTTLQGLTIAASDASAAIFNEGGASSISFALQGSDGTVKTFSLAAGATNSLNGLRDAINAAGAGVTATVVDSGVPGPSRYSLGLTQAGGGTFTLAETTTGGALNTLGIAAGLVNTTTVDGTPTSSIQGGSFAYTGTYTQGSQSGVDALFSVNGISMSRGSNTVTDAVDGLALTLKSGSQTGSTTLTVGVDNGAITTAMNDVVAKFNAVLSLYASNSKRTVSATSTSSTSSTSTTSSTGSNLTQDTTITEGALANDPGLRTLIESMRRDLMFTKASESSTDGYNSGAMVGLKTGRDGTLSLDSNALKTALSESPDRVATLFSNVSSTLSAHVTSITSPGSGDLANIISSVNQQNSRLSQQIATGQARLERQKAALQIQYANLEKLVGQMQAAGQSLGSLS